MKPPKLSVPQIRALEEIAHGRVTYDGMERRYRSTCWPPSIRTTTIERLVALGLAGPTDVGQMVGLTARGREMVSGLRAE